jgi:predicted nuclease with TOPRIM domain
MAEETKLKSQMSDGEAVKFSDDELQALQELQNTYASISTQFGQLKVSRMNLERQFNSLEQSEEALEKAWDDNRQKESELVQSLTEKYGPGSLNPETGEYTPVKSEETDNN